uniref:Dynein axonemal assembly factor 4 n=1 Tax=Denticeps clupeoides TaxID=299321 RepID=A0AAY4EJ75_9TELE
MPVIVQDYKWEQTDSAVFVSVPLKGMSASQVDVFSTDEYLKVRFPPFLFEAFLFAPVEDDKSTATIKKGEMLFTLQKRSKEMWSHLTVKHGMSDKETLKDLRLRAIQAAQEKAVARSKAKAEKVQEEKKYTLDTMMKWLKKQAEIRRGGVCADLHEFEDLSEEERNPDWLKEKGE